MELDKALKSPYRKWIVISVVLIILIAINLTMFWDFSGVSKTGTGARTFTVAKDSSSEAGGNSTYTPQKIGSVNVASGSTNHIDIKGG